MQLPLTPRTRKALITWLIVTSSAFSLPFALAQELPDKMQVPQDLRIETIDPNKPSVDAKQATPKEAPVPEPKPAERSEPASSDAAPIPALAPDKPKPADAGNPAIASDPKTSELSAPPRNPLPSAEELACRTRLKLLGSEFKEAQPIQDPSGCDMPFPVEISRLTDKIELNAPVVLNCATAETSARFMRDVASPAAEAEFGADLKSIAQASGFVCRPRNGTVKLSEHAFGNALDIASFTLTNGVVVTVEPAPPPKNEKYLRAVRDAACGPFKTVLGPGSNADHAQHFHFDLQQRRNGGTYCK